MPDVNGLTKRTIGLLGLLVVVAACGNNAPPVVLLDQTTTTTSVESTLLEEDEEEDESPRDLEEDDEADSDALPDPFDMFETSEEWVDVTGSLAGLESDCGNLAFVSGHPETDQVLAGVALQGLFELSEDGDDWEQLPASTSIENRTTQILYDPDDPDRYWQAGSYATGSYATTDNGATFQQLGSIDHLDSVSVDLTDPDRQTMLAGGHERTEIFRSTNGGQSWESLTDVLPEDSGFTSFPLVLTPTTYLLGTNGGSEAGIFRSTDEGETWSAVFDKEISSPPLVDGDTIYWLMTGGDGLAISRDGGLTFESAGNGTGGSPATLLQLTDELLATHSDRSILVSNDEGERWSAIGPPLPFEPWGLAYSAARSEFFIWQFTCDSASDSNPVEPMSIMRLSFDFVE